MLERPGEEVLEVWERASWMSRSRIVIGGREGRGGGSVGSCLAQREGWVGKKTE